MSYVIQNFYESTKKITLTPRFKCFFIFLFLNKFIFFIKLNNLTFLLKITNFSKTFYFVIFNKYFFQNTHVFVLNNLNLKLINFYSNNIIKSYVLITYKIINDYVKHIDITLKIYNNYNFFFLNSLYNTPVKSLNIQISFNFYKFFLYYSINYLSTFWFQYTIFFKFNLNFIISNNNLKLIRFYNGFFLKLYNY